MLSYGVRIFLAMLLLFYLAGCRSKLSQCGNDYNHNYSGSVKVGDPYDIKNITYTPKLDQHYDETGHASWYGHDFHCNKTANGEYFNKHQLSAAHKTLPMPSVVKVTNLANGKSIEVIINDRGPFVKGRIIDLSERAASAIDMKRHGVAKVRVQFLPDKTNKLMNEIASRKKIYYSSNSKAKIAQHKLEIWVATFSDQKLALMTMRRFASIAKVKLLVEKNRYKVILLVPTQDKLKILLKKVINMGYKDAKIHSY